VVLWAIIMLGGTRITLSATVSPRGPVEAGGRYGYYRFKPDVQIRSIQRRVLKFGEISRWYEEASQSAPRSYGTLGYRRCSSEYPR
jgi:hypothetical protein